MIVAISNPICSLTHSFALSALSALLLPAGAFPYPSCPLPNFGAEGSRKIDMNVTKVKEANLERHASEAFPPTTKAPRQACKLCPHATHNSIHTHTSHHDMHTHNLIFYSKNILFRHKILMLHTTVMLREYISFGGLIRLFCSCVPHFSESFATSRPYQPTAHIIDSM